MKNKFYSKIIFLALATISILQSCEQDNQSEETNKTVINNSKTQKNSKIEVVIKDGKSLLKVTNGTNVEYVNSYLNIEGNTILTSIDNKIIRNKRDMTVSKSGSQVVIDFDAYLGDGYMMQMCKGYPASLELVDINGELWLKEGGALMRAQNAYLNNLSEGDLAYFECMAMYDPMGIITFQ